DRSAAAAPGAPALVAVPGRDGARAARQGPGRAGRAASAAARGGRAMTAGNASELKSPATLAALLVDQLVAALVNVRIYASTHPRVQASLAAAQAHLADLAAT